MKQETSLDKASSVRYFRTEAILRRWKLQERTVSEMKDVMERLESRVTPRFFAVDDRGIERFCSDSSRDVTFTAESFCLVPIKIASVLSPFSWSLLFVIQA